MMRSIRILSITLILCLLTVSMSFATNAWIEEWITYRSISLVVNGKEVAPCDVNGVSTEPFIRDADGSTYLPVRAVAGALGLNVGWDGDTSTVVLTSNGSVKVGSNPVKSNRNVRSMLVYRDIQITLDGEVIPLKNALGEPVEPFVKDDSTYIPVRAVASALGCDVSWSERTSTVTIVNGADELAQRALWYRIQADRGDTEAAYNLGCCYYFGQGVQRDYGEAVYWFWVAAEKNHAKARYNLGLCFYYGQGVDLNYSDAVYCFQKAADLGLAEAQYNLGLCYFNGTGVPKNATQAVAWYRKAANQGYASAQNNLGVCYFNGTGVTKSETQAFNWFSKAAAQGLADGEYNLGICYEYGIGVTKNINEANKWYSLARQHGHV